MMSLIDLDDDQRWVPTHVNITVLRARALRTKGTHGSRYLYTTIQVGKEKYTTGLVEKAAVPEWNEECCFELLPGILEDGGRGAYPPGSGDLVLTVMHRVLIGLDVFLGQTTIPLDKIFHEGMCPRDEWFKLNSKAGRKAKERGELQVTVQFTRNNMTASMFDLTIKDKSRSAFGKLKDRVTGRKRGDVESSSAILPGRYAALSGTLGQPFGQEGGGGPAAPRDAEMAEEKRSKVKDFFKGRLRKSPDTGSCSSLASESSVSSVAGDSLGPPPSLDLMSDPPSSPIYTSKVRVDAHYGETDLAKKVLTSQHTTKVLTHKRAFSDEASKITTAIPRSNLAVESLKGPTMSQSKSSLCINGSHVYNSEPSTPKTSAAHQSKLALLEKCSPLSRSLQNLTKDRGSAAEGRRWSFDKMRKEEKDEEREAQVSSPPTPGGGRPVQAEMAAVSPAALSPDIGRKLRKTLFSGGRSDSLPAKSDLNQAGSTSEGRLRGWFGSGESQNKPRLEVSPKVESSSEAPPPLPPRSPVPSQYPPPPASPSGHVSPHDSNHTNPFTPSNSPSPNAISPAHLFPSHVPRNPFFEDLIAEESQRSPPFGSSPFHYTTLPSQPCTPSPAHGVKATNMAHMRRERPRPVARQISLPAMLPQTASPEPCAPRSMSESAGESEDSFEAFASSRLNSPKRRLPQKQPRGTATSSHRRSCLPVNNGTNNPAQELQTCEEEPPPLPPRKLLRTSANEIYSDGWLHRGQELAVHKEAYLLSQTGVASLQRGREGENKRNAASPDPPTSSENSGSLGASSQPHAKETPPGFAGEEKLKKFKYEPLEDETDRWGGTLFEQDLYGRMCRGNYGRPKVNRLPLSADEATTSVNLRPKILVNSETIVADVSNIPSTTSITLEALKITTTPAEKVEFYPSETTSPNNNASSSSTLGDLNMNVNSSDFGFIDSDGSSQSDVVDTLKGIVSFGGTFPQPTEAPQIAAYRVEAATTPQDVFTLKDTYIPQMNSSFEITASSNRLYQFSPVCKEYSELNNVVQHGKPGLNSGEMAAFSEQSQTSEKDAETCEVLSRSVRDFIKTQNDFDDNGNAQGKTGPLNPKETFAGVVSARFRPKGVSRQNSSGSPSNQSKSADRELEQFLSLVQNISESSEGPLSYQPSKSAFSSSVALGDHSTTQPGDPTATPLASSNGNPTEAGKASRVAFEDLHAQVAPNPRTPSKSKIGPSLRETSSSSVPDAIPLSADPPAALHPTPVCRPSMHPSDTGPSATLAVAPYTSYSTTSTTDRPPVDARHSLLPEETLAACSLPRQESRTHPVKPLSQLEKKDSRSVLEKLKSTINPGRVAHQVAAEPERSPEVSVDHSAQYQHLTNMELISLLLQKEMDLQKQAAASERQAAQTHKCEAELKKVKLQVRDLEDYIDNLLLRIMEQTPTLLQVRNRHK
ncbi:rab11fip5 [Pungitius sinensis]